MGVEFIFFVQTNTLDRRNRTLHIEAYNESFSSRVTIQENCKYTVSIIVIFFVLFKKINPLMVGLFGAAVHVGGKKLTVFI